MNKPWLAMIVGGLTAVAKLLTLKQRRERAAVVLDAFATHADGLTLDERLAVQRFVNRVLVDAGLPGRYPEASIAHGGIDLDPAFDVERAPTVPAATVRVLGFHPRRLKEG